MDKRAFDLEERVSRTRCELLALASVIDNFMDSAGARTLCREGFTKDVDVLCGVELALRDIATAHDELLYSTQATGGQTHDEQQ